MAAFEHSIESAIRGFHVYKEVWSPFMHEQLRTRQELGNPEDQYAVAWSRTTAVHPLLVGQL